MSNTLNTPIEALELAYPLRVGRTSCVSDPVEQAAIAVATGWCASCALSRPAGSRCSPSGGAGPSRRAGWGGRSPRGRNLLNGEELPAFATLDLDVGDLLPHRDAQWWRLGSCPRASRD